MSTIETNQLPIFAIGIALLYLLECSEDSNAMPIHNVLILKSSGQNVFSWTQRSFNLDDDLLSSFTSAIFTFTQELGEKSIHVLDMENLKFLYAYEQENDLILAMGIDRDDEKQLGTFKTVLDEIKTVFIEKYGSLLVNFDGEISVFKEFGTDVDRIVQTIQEQTMGHIIAVPFLVDNTGEEITNFQKEIALMFALFEDLREKGGGRLFKKRNEKIEYLTKVLWPFWVINTNQGPVIIDGFSLTTYNKTVTTPINLASFEDILKTSALNSIFALDKVEVLLNQMSKKEFKLDAMVEPDLLEAILEIFPTIQYYETSEIFSEPLRSVFSKNQAIIHGTKIEECFQFNQEATQSLEQLQSLLITTTNNWKIELNAKLQEIEDDFSSKLTIIKEEVQKAIEKIVVQRENEIEGKKLNTQSKIDELYDTFHKETKILGESTRSLLKYSGQILQSNPSKSEEDFAETFIESIRRKRLLLSSVEAAFHNTEDTLNKIEIQFDKLQYSLQKEINDIIVKYNKLVSEQNERIVLLKKEFEEKRASISVSTEMLESKRDKLLEMIESVRQSIINELSDLKKFIIPSGSIPAALTKHAVISYMPCYVTKFVNREDVDGVRFVVIPPCHLLSKYKPVSKKIPISIDPHFFDAIKQRLEMALEERKELQRIFDTVCTENNFLNDKEIETKIYDGLKEIFEYKLISSKDYEKLSLACIETFRK
ncbi:MAG: hypothetical protein ACFFA5_04770 [Promethearchaeota archaeon]